MTDTKNQSQASTPPTTGSLPAADPVYHTVLITGDSTTGKSTSLRNLRAPEGVVYFNCEVGKNLPFKTKFKQVTIKDPLDLYSYIDQVAQKDEYHTIIIDSLSFLMNMYENKYIKAADGADKRQAWSNYKLFYDNLMDIHVKNCGKNVIILSHVEKINDEDPSVPTSVAAAVKGSLRTVGVEASFTTVISTKKMSLEAVAIKNVDPALSKTLKDLTSNLLVITDEEEQRGFKHVFQTTLTSNTTGERIRGPIGLFDLEESFMDNDVQKLLDRMDEYYN